MALETVTYISDLVATNPESDDPKSEGDDHIRNLKSAIKATFPGITGAVTVTHTELNSVTSRGLRGGDTWTGEHTFPATTYGVTAAFGATGTAYATLDYVNAVALNAALPGQSGKAGMELVSDGITAYWAGKNARSGIAVITSTQTWQPPEGVTRVKRTIVDGGYSSGTSTLGASSAGRGGNASVGFITVDPAVTYTATIGAGGIGGAAETNTSPAAGGASSLSGSGLTTQTSANGDFLCPGGIPPLVNSTSAIAFLGGSSLIATNSSGAGAGYGAGAGSAAQNAAGFNGAAGVIIIEY